MRVALVALLLGMSGSALAQHRGTDPDTRARELYKAGLTHYDLADYDRAVDEFKQAYELSHRPELLFNLAQTYRAKKDYDLALHFYRTFLELDPNARNRADVETTIAEVEATRAEARRAAEPPKPVVEPPTPVVEPPKLVVEPPKPVVRPPAPRPFLSTVRGRATLAIGIVGGVAFVGAAGAGGLAVARRGAYDTSCRAGDCNDGLYTEGRSAAIATDVLIAVGVAAAITTVVLVLTRPRAVRPTQASLQF